MIQMSRIGPGSLPFDGYALFHISLGLVVPFPVQQQSGHVGTIHKFAVGFPQSAGLGR